MNTKFKYHVALSFAGEDRQYVEKVVEELNKYEIKSFYDKNNESDLWGKNLYEHLARIIHKSLPKVDKTIVFALSNALPRAIL